MKNNNISILESHEFLQFISKWKLKGWSTFILFHELQRFVYSHDFSKKEVLEIFAYFKFDEIDALDVYMKKCFYSTRIKMGNLRKLKDSFTIFMIVFDTLYHKDAVDMHYNLNNSSRINKYYEFIPKIDICTGWSHLLFMELIGFLFSFELLYHIQLHKRFFVKVGVFSLETRDLLLKIIKIKKLVDPDSREELAFLIKELRLKANLSMNHVFQILSSNIILIILLDSTIYEDSLQNTIRIEYFDKNPDKDINEFTRITKDYQDNFVEDFEYYERDFSNFMHKYQDMPSTKKAGLSSKIKNFISISKSFFYKEDNQPDKYTLNKDLLLSIDSPHKEKFYLMHYHFQHDAKLDFFNLIISKYNNRLYTNKNKLHKILKEQKDYVNPYPSRYDEYLVDDLDGYFFYDLSDEENQELIAQLQKESKDSVASVEKKLQSLVRKENYNDVIEFVIQDSFNYLKFFFYHLHKHGFTSEEVCLLFNSKKYKLKK